MSSTSDTGSARGRKSDRTRRNELSSFHVYNRVRILRQDLGVSRERMAGDLSINHRTLGNLECETYQPTIGLAYEISGYFRMPMDAVFSGEPMKPLSQEVFGPSKA